ncbi:hypothetical protein [Streptomyces caatingaensis]|uniref:hypothetical protein n=1 Tax=Streptomyces caatingaensis TaxID=1678637 RepID=UPI0012FF3360|nr:hypothetical protein [Streptomyces caatingaensis]
MTVKLDSLSSAAAKWDEMAQAFHGVESVYRSKVLSVSTDGIWVGHAADASYGRFTGTREQLTAAQTQAKAIASLLRDAHSQLTTLVQKVKSLVSEARKEGMHIDSEGRATFDFSKVKPTRNDPDYPAFLSKCREAEASWTEAIKKAVQAVDDADQGVKYALHQAADIHPNSVFHDFNAKAVGDIEVYEAREAKAYADRIIRGDKLNASERAELARLYRDNANDQVFSRTMLDSLGPENTLKLANKFNDLAYFDDADNKKDYLNLEKGLADTVNSATRIPEFKGSDGKVIPYGSKAYRQALRSWSGTKEGEFYGRWREGMRKAGVEQYDLEVAEGRPAGFKGSGQQVRGYQSLVTLMKHADGVSPQFLSDIADDMIAVEKKDKNIWDLYGNYGDKSRSWFAHDPVDEVLGIMSRDPKTATAYLDPGAGGEGTGQRGNDRLHYLLKERDWNVVSDTQPSGIRDHGAGNLLHSAPDLEAVNGRKGLGAAIEAAATGSPPGSGQHHGGKHTIEEARVLQGALNALDEGGGADSVHKNLQAPLARTLVDYSADTHRILGGNQEYVPEDGGHIHVPGRVLVRTLRGVSDSPENFTMLYEAERLQAAYDLHNAETQPGVDWRNRARNVGLGMGAFNAISTDILFDARDARKSWADDVAKYVYHGGGAPITLLPGLGDAAQRVVDIATYDWGNDIKSEAEEVGKVESSKRLEGSRNAARDLIDSWARAWGRDPGTDAHVSELRHEMGQSFGVSRRDVMNYLGRE